MLTWLFIWKKVFQLNGRKRVLNYYYFYLFVITVYAVNKTSETLYFTLVDSHHEEINNHRSLFLPQRTHLYQSVTHSLTPRMRQKKGTFDTLKGDAKKELSSLIMQASKQLLVGVLITVIAIAASHSFCTQMHFLFLLLFVAKFWLIGTKQVTVLYTVCIARIYAHIVLTVSLFKTSSNNVKTYQKGLHKSAAL